MKIHQTALVATSAVIISSLGGIASPAQAAGWRTGWCQKNEGLSVVVDFGGQIADSVPAEGFMVRCLAGGVVLKTSEGTRVDALRAVGLDVASDGGGYITAIEGVEEYDGNALWWLFSGAVVPGPWDTGNHGIVYDGPNVDKAFGARLMGEDLMEVPRPTPQFTDPTQETTPEPSPAPLAPDSVSGTIPALSGKARVGAFLTSTLGAWSHGASISRHWKRDGAVIRGARAASYRLTSADRGTRITLEVTGSKADHSSTTMTSIPTIKVRAGRLTPAKPRVAGKTKVSKTLKAVSAKWKPAKVKLSYRWLRNGKPIAGARKKTYVLKSRDQGRRISVKVTGNKAGYAKASRTSKKTVRVTR